MRAHHPIIGLFVVLQLFAGGVHAAEPETHGSLLAQETPDQWRASKLAGVSIYGPDNKSIGKITDILLKKDGSADYVVIGVGGFLGIGEKDVAVPFKAVNFTDQPVVPQGMAAAPNGNASTGLGGAVAPASSGGMAASMQATGAAGQTGAGAANGGMSDTTGSMRRSTTYPDHGVIAMTADQLKSAPSFQFAK